MSQFLNRKKTRNNLISYFKAISKIQKQIQTVQQILISHVRFNPIVLYDKITSHENNKMTIKDLKQYFKQTIGIKKQEGVKLYFIKHNLNTKQKDDSIVTLEMFLQSLIPYTPNCLRDVNETIYRQLQTQHLDMTVEQIYHKLINIQTQNLYFIRLLQREINLSWCKIQSFIVQDIVERGKKIDLTIKQNTDIVYIRKWMELWTQVDEYEVLNLMRFFNGGSQQNILKIYENNVPIRMRCTCQSNSLYPQHTQKLQDNKLKAHSIHTDYFSQLRDNKHKSKHRFQTQVQKIENNNSKEIIFSSEKNHSTQKPKYNQQGQKLKSNSLKNQIKQTLLLQDKQSENYLNTFTKYIKKLVQTQKFLEFNRLILKPYKKEVQDIIHDILSKKKSFTKVQKIFLYIGKFLKLKAQRFQKLIQKFGNAKIQNSAIFSLFSSQISQKKIFNKIKRQDRNLSPKDIIRTISSILFKYISTKFQLLNLSQLLIKHYSQIPGAIISFLNQQQLPQTQSLKRKQKKLTTLKINKQDLQLFLLKFQQIKLDKKYILLLMNHLGNGDQISTKNLIKVFEKQKQYQNAKLNKQ